MVYWSQLFFFHKPSPFLFFKNSEFHGLDIIILIQYTITITTVMIKPQVRKKLPHLTFKNYHDDDSFSNRSEHEFLKFV